MGTEFAEKMIDSMVDENGHCGERGLSEKQFDILAQYLDCEGTEILPGWYGNRGGHIQFTKCNYSGTIGKYQVVLNEFWHFHRRCTVVEINLRPQDEIDLENWLNSLGKFEHSEWAGNVKERKEIELTLVREYCYEVASYSGYGIDLKRTFVFADDSGNCYVWKTTNDLGNAEPGDEVIMKATIKDHSEYKGVKQTTITRPSIIGIKKRNTGK